MTLLKSFFAALGLFTRVPVPRMDWDGREMKYMLCFFPVAGVLIGLMLWGLASLCGLMGWGAVPFGAGVALIPVAVTGGLHLDGYCDVADALAVHGDPEKRRAVLKDPHCGAFAVIRLVSLMLAYFALGTLVEISPRTALLLGCVHVMSRAAAALALLFFPPSGGSGMLRHLRGGASRGVCAVISVVWFAVAAGGLIWHAVWPAGAVVCAAALVCLLRLRVMSRRAFGGMSGDLAGWFVQVCEAACLAALVISERAVSL